MVPQEFGHKAHMSDHQGSYINKDLLHCTTYLYDADRNKGLFPKDKNSN